MDCSKIVLFHSYQRALVRQAIDRRRATRRKINLLDLSLLRVLLMKKYRTRVSTTWFIEWMQKQSGWIRYCSASSARWSFLNFATCGTTCESTKMTCLSSVRYAIRPSRKLATETATKARECVSEEGLAMRQTQIIIKALRRNKLNKVRLRITKIINMHKKILMIKIEFESNKRRAFVQIC